MTWRRGIKKLALVSVGASRFPGWALRDKDCCWLEALTNMTQNQRGVNAIRLVRRTHAR